MKKFFSCCIIATTLCGCVKNPSQNQYNYNEAGQSVIMEFGKIISVKEIGITGKNTGTGAAVGTAAGAAGGYQVGNARGQAVGLVAGAIIGGIAGHMAEQAAADQKGYQYVVATEHKEIKKIIQYQNADDVKFKKGDKVMVETKGTYQRILPIDDMPDAVSTPKGVKFVN